MRVLITGGAGYIGSAVTRLLLERRHEVVVYDNLSTGHRSAVPPAATFVRCPSYSTLDEVGETLDQHDIEAVVHLAALASVADSLDAPDDYWHVNVRGTLNLVDAMAYHGCKRLVFASSCSVYGECDGIQHEGVGVSPISPYGRTKAAAEWVASDYAGRNGWTLSTLRLFNVAGAWSPDCGESPRSTRLIPNAIRAALGQRPPLELFGDGSSLRTYVNVRDVAEAVVLCLERQQERTLEVFNVGDTLASQSEVVAAVEAAVGPVPTIRKPRRDGDPHAAVGSVERIRQRLGWEPVHDLVDCVESAAAWHRLHPEGYDAGR